jgi:hypothetical protein
VTGRDVCKEFFASGTALPEWRSLRLAGVPLGALCNPQMILADDIVVEGPEHFAFARHSESSAGRRAVLMPVTDHAGQLIDIAAWCQDDHWLGVWLGRGWALGQDAVWRPRCHDEGALPVWRSPLDWLLAGRRGLLIIRRSAAPYTLENAGPLLAEDLAHAADLRRVLTRAGPRILVRYPETRSA